MRLFSICALSILLVHGERDCLALDYDMYRADYAKGAFCTAIAGACASDDEPENSFFQNPASLEAGEPELVYDGDFNPTANLEPGMKVSNSVSSTRFMGGVGWAGEKWGYAFAFSGTEYQVQAAASLATSDNGDLNTLSTTNSSTTLLFNLPVAYRVTPKFSVGGALLGMYYTESFDVQGYPSSGTTNIDKVPQLGFSFGALYKANTHFHFGSWFRTPLTFYVNQDINRQIGSTDVDINEDVGLHYPLVFSNGVTWMPWADNHAILFDLDVIGTTGDGYERTLDRFSTLSDNPSVLRAKGRTVALEPHLAWRSPWTDTSFGTYTVGSYYENGRWDGLSGRVHGVTSLAYNFKVVETIVAADVATGFFDLQVSFR